MLRLLVLCVFAVAVSANYNCPDWAYQPTFNCTKLPTPPPATDVRMLAPGNIAAIMSFGDSITAGFAMKDEPLEYRGLVYSTGGDDGAVTIGNILLENYNANITGMCTGKTVPLEPEGCMLSGAVSGAVVQDIPKQVDNVVRRIKNTKKYPQFEGLMDKWKYVVLFIGANNACGCTSASNQPDQFESNLRAALSHMESELPNTFVSVMTIFNISDVWDVAQNSSVRCTDEIEILKECHCLNENATERLQMDELSLQYNKISQQVADDFASKENPQFTVSVQPGVSQMSFSKWGENFLSDLDCFHPSLCTDEGFTMAIWNNMWEPVGSKSTSFDPHYPQAYKCPTEKDFIQ